MADYRIITRFEMTAPIAEVWASLARPEDWVTRWDEVSDVVSVDPGRPDRVGARHAFRLQPLRFTTLSFETEIVRSRAPDIIEWEVSGDLEGRASWELDDLDELTIGRNVWEVRTTPSWLNALAPAARTTYRRRQQGLMRSGVQALASHLDASLVSTATSTHRPEKHRMAGLALRVGPGGRDRSS